MIKVTPEELNDILVELPYGKRDEDVELEGVAFRLSQYDAKEFCLEYGIGTYNQNAVRAAKSVKNMRECEDSCGFVEELA